MNINGVKAELVFGIWLLDHGFEVFYPCGPGGTADVVWRAGPAYPWRSAQIKKVYRPARPPHNPKVKLRRRDGTRYAPGDADYFACVDYEKGHLWMLPLYDTCQYGELTLSRKRWRKYRRDL